MFIKFLIILGAIVVAGPGHNEGGFEAIKAKGFSAIEDGIKAGDASTLTGNYGNE